MESVTIETKGGTIIVTDHNIQFCAGFDYGNFELQCQEAGIPGISGPTLFIGIRPLIEAHNKSALEDAHSGKWSTNPPV